MKKILMTALAVLTLPAMSWAQFTVSGKVTDKSSSASIAGPSISMKPYSGIVDANGNYAIKNVKSGLYTIKIYAVGFEAQEKVVDVKANLVVNFSLTTVTVLTDAVLVQATRALGNAAITYKNIDKETIAKNNFGQDLPFLLDNTPGVVVTSDAGAGVGYTGIRIRGSDATRVNVTLNGIPYNDSESQGTFWVNMPDFASSIENIQIQRGVGTSTNGAGAFGGSLNIQTSAVSKAPFVEVNNSYGSFNTLKNTVKLGSGLIGDKFSFEGRLSRIKSDGFIDRAAANLKSFFVTGAYQGKKDLLRVNVFAGSETTYQAWNGIPEAKVRGNIAGVNDYIVRNGLNTADAANILNAGNRTYNSFTYQDQSDNYWQSHYQLLYANKLSDKLLFNGALHYTAGKGYYEELKPDQKIANYGLQPVVIGGTTISRTDLVRRRWLDNDFYGATYSLNYNPSSKISLAVGGAYNKYDGDHFGQVIYAQFGSNGNNARHYYDNTGEKNDFNFYGKLTVRPTEKLSLFADLQYRTVGYKINGTEKNLNLLEIKDDLSFFNPKFGVSYNASAASNFYAAFSIANKEPNRDDYINVNQGTLPLSEKLSDVELGYRFKSNAFTAGINAYGMFYKNQLVITGKINDVGEYFRQNEQDSYRAGVELDLAYNFNERFAINANAAFSNNKLKNFTEFTDDYDNGGQIETIFKNTDISFSPRIVTGGELVYSISKGLAIAFQEKFVSRQYLDNTQNKSRSLNSYAVSNLRLGYDFTLKSVKNVNIGLLVNNLFDKTYESNGYTFGYFAGGAVTTENFYFPQAGTNILLALNLKF